MRLRAWLTARRSEVFIIALFYLLCFGIFGERFWFFSNQIEHVGIRRVVQWSVPVTRGCASAMLFALAVLLLTMSKNLLSYLHGTRAARFIPFESAVSFHILVAYTFLAALPFSARYQISTQPMVDTPCYLPDVAYASSFLPSFTFWFFGTATNLSGVLLTLFFIFFFLVAAAHDSFYNFFVWTHKLFVFGYVLIFVHGMQQLFAAPLAWPVIVGPAAVLVLDRLWSFARVNAPLSAIRA